MRGTVKWFSASKGYGFIVSKDAQKDVYVHFSDIKMPGFKNLEVNQDVNFDLIMTDRGLAAKEVVVD